MSTAEQLQPKEKIEMEHIQITDSEIRVSSGCTIFVDMVPLTISYDDAIARYKAMLKLARKYGAKVIYRHKRSTKLKALEKTIKAELHDYQSLYNILKERWKTKAHNIYVGYCDDQELDELAEIRNTMWRMLHCNTPIDELIQFSRAAEDAARLIESSNGHCVIYV